MGRFNQGTLVAIRGACIKNTPSIVQNLDASDCSPNTYKTLLKQMPVQFRSDGYLVEKARSGDDRARDDLLAKLQPVLRAFFIQRIGLKPDVDDLVQNTLLRVHNSLDDLKHPSRLKGFAMKAALFELQDLYRGRYGAKERLYDPEYPPEQAHQDGVTGLKVDLERALSSLSPRARRIVELKEFGYRYEEIAEMVGSTEAAVKMQVKRAFEKLRDVLVSIIIVFFALLNQSWS